RPHRRPHRPRLPWASASSRPSRPRRWSIESGSRNRSRRGRKTRVSRRVRMKPFEAKRTEEWTLPSEGTSALRARTADSAIRVTGAVVDQIRVVAMKRARAATEAEAQAFLDQITVERQRDGERWLVEANWPEPRPRHVESVGCSFEIQVPHGFNLEA